MASEKRLIDANDLLNAIRDDYNINGTNFARIRQHIEESTAVEVVRCKDCKYYCQDKINGVICRHPALDFDTECFDHWINTNPDDFCSYGERKDGDK